VRSCLYALNNHLPFLSGGAIHSPQILMLSGIGPAAQLLRHNIPVVLDVPSVGANLMDHPSVNLRFRDKTGTTFHHFTPHSLNAVFLLIRDLLRYQLWGTGPLASSVRQVFLALTSPVLNSIIDWRVCSILPIRRPGALPTRRVQQ
jgi:choline dehydrogenase